MMKRVGNASNAKIANALRATRLQIYVPPAREAPRSPMVNVLLVWTRIVINVMEMRRSV